MESTEIERKMKEIEDKFRIELGRTRVDLIKVGYKSNLEQCERLRQEIKQNIRRMVQEELMYFKRENFALQRQITAMQQHLDSQKWNEKRNERKFMYEIEMLRNSIKDLTEAMEKTQESNEVGYKQRYQ